MPLQKRHVQISRHIQLQLPYPHHRGVLSEGVCLSQISSFATYKNQSMVAEKSASVLEVSQNLKSSALTHDQAQCKHFSV